MRRAEAEQPWHWYVALRTGADAATVHIQQVADARAARALTESRIEGASLIAIEAKDEASAREHAREYWQLPGQVPPRGRQRRRHRR